MGAAISGLLVLSILFTSALMFFRVGLFGDVLLGNSFEDAQDLLEERLETRISIGTTTIDTVFRCETQINLTLKNIGDVSISEFDQVDFIPWYVPVTGDDRIFQFIHTGGNLDTDEWSVSSIDGDSINPGILDPGETANLTSRLKQQPKQGELGYVTVATPDGITASEYVDFEDAISGECFYLHHDPSPPTNHTDRPAAHLPWGDKLPSAGTLYNYNDVSNTPDQPGLKLDKTNLGISESDTTKFQRWRTGALSSDLVISGDTLISLWAAAKDYNTGDIGIITLYLRDYDPDTDTYASGSDPVAQGTLFSTAWQAGITGDFVQRGVLVPDVSYTVIAGHELEAFGVVENNSSQEMRLAYDTEKYASLVNVEYDAPTPLTVYYLHDEPTPPTAGGTSSAALTMTTTVPTSTGDANGDPFNYDTDRDSSAGLKIDKTNLGISEADSTKMQVWRTGALSSDLVISGDVIIELWAAVKDFSLSKTGVVTMYLRDKDGSTYTEIGDTSVFDADWQEGSSAFIKKSMIIPDVDHTVSSGHELEIRLQVENQSDDAMWIAYDTVSHNSVIKLP